MAMVRRGRKRRRAPGAAGAAPHGSSGCSSFRSFRSPHINPILAHRAARHALVCARLYRRHHAGWLYARAIIASPRLWGGQPPLTVVTSTISSFGSRSGSSSAAGSATCCSTTPAFRSPIPPRSLQLWKGGMSFHGGFLGCVLAVVLFARARHPVPLARRHDRPRSPRSGCFSAASPTSSMENCGAGRPTCHGPWSFRSADARPPSEPTLRSRRSKALLSSSCACWYASARSGGPASSPAPSRLAMVSRGLLRAVPRARRSARLSLGRADDGHAALHPADPRRLGRHRLRFDPRNRLEKMADQRSPLESEIRRLIAAAGPMPVADYMRLCLSHPQYGYYITRDPFGADGDFITAPEISQMFGELVGLWMAAVWRQMGAPDNVRMVELGPGRGTLLADALRATIVLGDFARCHGSASGRDQPAPAKEPAATAAKCFDLQTAWHRPSTTSPADRASSSPTSSSMPCRCIRRSSRPTAGTSASSISMPMAILPSASRAIRCHLSMHRCRRQCGMPPVGAIFEWRTDAIALELGHRVRTAARPWSSTTAMPRAGSATRCKPSPVMLSSIRWPRRATDLTAHVDFQALAKSAKADRREVPWPAAAARAPWQSRNQPTGGEH